MAQSQIHLDANELNQAGQNHSTSRRGRRPVRDRPVRGITFGCHRPPPPLPGCLRRARWAQGLLGTGRQPGARAFGARQAVPRTTLPSPWQESGSCGSRRACREIRGRLLGPDPAHNSGFSGPAGSAHIVPSLPPVGDAIGGRGETGVLPCEGLSDGLSGQSSFLFVSAAPVIGHFAEYRCRRCPGG